jgi:hypothetical protein
LLNGSIRKNDAVTERSAQILHESVHHFEVVHFNGLPHSGAGVGRLLVLRAGSRISEKWEVEDGFSGHLGHPVFWRGPVALRKCL